MARPALVLLSTALIARTHALDNGVGLTPPMGFNTYQSPWPFQGGYAPVIAAALQTHGLKAAGYAFLASSSSTFLTALLFMGEFRFPCSSVCFPMILNADTQYPVLYWE